MKRAASRGPLRRATVGELAAARLAVHAKRRGLASAAGVDLSAKRGARVARARRAPHGTVAALSLSDGMAERPRVVDGSLRVTGCRVVRGRHRCAEAALVVVRDLSILHDVGALAADTAVSFLYVVALGLDVVTATQLPAASRKKAAFRVGERLNVECPAVAFRRIARRPGSRISVVASGAPASGGVSLLTLQDAVHWAASARMN